MVLDVEVGEIVVGAAAQLGLHVDGLRVPARQGEGVGGIGTVSVHAAVTVNAREDGIGTHVAHGEGGQVGQAGGGLFGTVLKGDSPADGVVALVGGGLHRDRQGIAEETRHAGGGAVRLGGEDGEVLGKAVVALAVHGIGHGDVSKEAFEVGGHGEAPFGLVGGKFGFGGLTEQSRKGKVFVLCFPLTLKIYWYQYVFGYQPRKRLMQEPSPWGKGDRDSGG